MKVGKRCANGDIALETAGRCVEDKLWRREGVIFMELKKTVVKSSKEGRLKVDEAEVEIQEAVPDYQCLVDRLFL